MSAPTREPGSDPSPWELPPDTGIVHVVSEYWPFARTGGLGEAVRGIATYQAAAGRRTTIVLPLYRSVRDHVEGLKVLPTTLDVPMGTETLSARLLEHVSNGGPGEGDSGSEPRVLFVDQPHLYDRDGIYGTDGVDFADNHLRFGFLALAALEALPFLGSKQYVLHAHDWHAALVPVYLRTLFSGIDLYDRSAAVFTVHNAGYQGQFPPDVLADLGLPNELFRWNRMEWYGTLNWLKGGIVFADYVGTVSPTHAHELRTPTGGFGLHDPFIALGDRLVGIRNGIDLSIWDPETDPNIAANYGPADMGGKAVCKAELQAAYGLEVVADTPLVAMTARLAKQKGFDIILADGLLDAVPAQFVFLGEGDRGYAEALAAASARNPGRIAARFEFTEPREHRLLAGADFLMMPSLYEPCGLTQMRAQRYGALPVVRRVGGLSDTVEDQVTGFVFDEYEPWALGVALKRGIDTYRSGGWAWHQREAMNRDFGWLDSARRYKELYRRALERAPGTPKRAPPE